MPQKEIIPQTEQDLTDGVRWAVSEQIPLSITGSGHRSGIGHPVKADTRLTVRALSGITFYEPAELVLSAQAGTPLSDIQSVLAEKKQMLAFEPPVLGALCARAYPGLDIKDSPVPKGSATIGGTIALGYSGPRRPFAGGVRDHVLGFRGVHGRGEATISGARVVKNVTGYDLGKLITGSFGTLAVFSEVTVKVLPMPDFQCTLLIPRQTRDEALQTLRDISQTPYEPSGLCWLPPAAVQGQDSHLAVVRLEGVFESVQARSKAIVSLVRRSLHRLEADESDQLWSDIREAHILYPFADSEDIWRICVPPAEAGPVCEKLDQLTARLYADWIGGLIWAAIPRCHAGDVRACFSSGAATVIRQGPSVDIPVFQPAKPALSALEQRVRRAFDPHRILNPGILGSSG